ncbi:MAG: ABC transporter ATP-binding protein [candidate division WOR-3 bacterium]
MTLIKIRDLKKTYLEHGVEAPALRGINLEVDEGEFVAIAGPSGSGKTTLLNIIGGLDKPTSGSVIVDGVDLGALSKSALADYRLRKVGFVFQSYNLIEVLTALENAEFVLLLQKVPKAERRARAKEVLEAMGMGEYLNKRPNRLSGGQQQRIAVARALAHNPRIVLADEPTANLDSATASGLLDMMREMNERYGVTFVFSTHDRLVMDKAKRVILLRDGVVVGDERKG